MLSKLAMTSSYILCKIDVRGLAFGPGYWHDYNKPLSGLINSLFHIRFYISYGYVVWFDQFPWN